MVYYEEKNADLRNKTKTTLFAQKLYTLKSDC